MNFLIEFCSKRIQSLALLIDCYARARLCFAMFCQKSCVVWLAVFIVLSMCLLIEMNAETKTCALIAVSMRKVCACMCAYCVRLSHAATCLSIACEKGWIVSGSIDIVF